MNQNQSVRLASTIRPETNPGFARNAENKFPRLSHDISINIRKNVLTFIGANVAGQQLHCAVGPAFQPVFGLIPFFQSVYL